jgi:hypothetical protein
MLGCHKKIYIALFFPLFFFKMCELIIILSHEIVMDVKVVIMIYKELYQKHILVFEYEGVLL